MVSKTVVSTQSATPVDMPPADAPTHPAADIFPALSDADYIELRHDIELHGVLEPIWVDLEGRVLDGRHRLRAAHELGITCATLVYDGPDPIGFVHSLNFHRRHLTPSQRGMVAAKMATLRQGRPAKDTPQKCGVSTKQAAEKLRVSTRTVEHAKVVLKHGSPEIIRAVDNGDIRVGRAAALVRAAAKELPSKQVTHRKSTADDPWAPSAIAEYLRNVGTGRPGRWGSLREVDALAKAVSGVPRACLDVVGLFENPRIIAKLSARSAKERDFWLTAVQRARKALGGIEPVLLRALELAPPAANTAPPPASDALHNSEEDHHG